MRKVTLCLAGTLDLSFGCLFTWKNKYMLKICIGFKILLSTFRFWWYVSDVLPKYQQKFQVFHLKWPHRHYLIKVNHHDQCSMYIQLYYKKPVNYKLHLNAFIININMTHHMTYLWWRPAWVMLHLMLLQFLLKL